MSYEYYSNLALVNSVVVYVHLRCSRTRPNGQPRGGWARSRSLLRRSLSCFGRAERGHSEVPVRP